MAVKERLEVAHRGRQMTRLLDLEGELARAGSVGPAADDQELVTAMQLRRRRGRGIPRVEPGGHQRPTARTSTGVPDAAPASARPAVSGEM